MLNGWRRKGRLASETGLQTSRQPSASKDTTSSPLQLRRNLCSNRLVEYRWFGQEAIGVGVLPLPR